MNPTGQKGQADLGCQQSYYGTRFFRKYFALLRRDSQDKGDSVFDVLARQIRGGRGIQWEAGEGQEYRREGDRMRVFQCLAVGDEFNAAAVLVESVSNRQDGAFVQKHSDRCA